MRLGLRTMSVVVALAALSACGGGDDGEAAAAPVNQTGAEAVVTIKTFSFGPDPITVKAGETIVFRNLDKINHTVTAGTREHPTPDVFDGHLDTQGATFELTLDEPGTYEYFCNIHPGPGMTAEIVVER